jgi:class 3 adenylate cyclase
VDIVGFSRHPMEEQARLVGELRRIVQAVPEHIRTSARKDVISLDTGDGMALVFFRDPLAPVQCAVEIARAVRAHAGLGLRMGVHSGPVSRTADVNGRENVTGSGINTAQRVMACGDLGHILLSSASAEVICEFDAWKGCVHEIGDAEAKHGQRIRLFNLLVGEVGNPEPPSALSRSSSLAENEVVQAISTNKAD